jgi:flavin reductase (DIM6/NTAB) family NADH-FMN oxidoreductase RutF
MDENDGEALFRRVIGLFATGVTVIAAESEGEIHGMTANAVASVSLKPMLVLACINRQALMANVLSRTKEFSINILRDDQQALSTYFAGAWTDEAAPPFRFVPWDGRPRLEGCAAALGCRVWNILDGGDHWIIVAMVLALQRGIDPIRPLLFYGGEYGRIDSARRAPAPDLGWVARPVQVFYDPWKEE